MLPTVSAAKGLGDNFWLKTKPSAQQHSKKNKTKPASNIDLTSLLFRTEAHQNMLPETQEARESGRGLPELRAAPAPGVARRG